MAASAVQCAIIGSGNIGTDLMIKILRTSKLLEVKALVGIDPASDGLALGRRLGVATIDGGVRGLVEHACFADIDLVFDATSAHAHIEHDRILRAQGKQLVDLTPAAIGPFNVPVVNATETLGEQNVNMVSCGGQATIPIVAAVSRVTRVHYAEIVASIASKSAGPGTRASIDEFTTTTANALERVGGASKAKAIIVLNPAEPPMLMRNTVFTLSDDCNEAAIEESVERMVAEVQKYVPGYRLKQRVQFERSGSGHWKIPGQGEYAGLKSVVFLEVEGAAHYLPKYAGNLDIMTSAALAAGERLAAAKLGGRALARGAV